MAKYFKRIFYRTASTVITAATKDGSYPNFTVSGWTPLPGSVEVATMQPDAEIETPADGGSTDTVHAEQLPTEITITDVSAAEFNTLRSLNGEKMDILFMDPDQPEVCYAAHGVRLYVKPVIESAAVMKVVISGLRRYGTQISTSPFQMVAVT